MSAPHALSHVNPVCRDLVRAYPKISVDLVLTDRFVELIDERMDVVVRIGVLRDSNLVLNWPRQTRFSGGTSHTPWIPLCPFLVCVIALPRFGDAASNLKFAKAAMHITIGKAQSEHTKFALSLPSEFRELPRSIQDGQRKRRYGAPYQ